MYSEQWIGARREVPAQRMDQTGEMPKGVTPHARESGQSWGDR